MPSYLNTFGRVRRSQLPTSEPTRFVLQDVAALLCADEDSASWGESPSGNVHASEASRVLELGLQLKDCGNLEYSHADSASEYHEVFDILPADLPASLVLRCSPPPCEPADTEFVDTFRWARDHCMGLDVLSNMSCIA